MAYEVGRCLLPELLRKSDLSQQELADALGVKIQQVNKYVLNVRVMTLQTAKNISTILNCSINDLYDWVEVGNNE